jgi:hypothetical protein
MTATVGRSLMVTDLLTCFSQPLPLVTGVANIHRAISDTAYQTSAAYGCHSRIAAAPYSTTGGIA